MAQFKYDVEDNANELLKDAAARVKQSKQKFLETLIDRAAAKEYERQQRESANE